MKTLFDASSARHALGAFAALAALSGCNAIPEADVSGSGRAAPPDTALATSAQGIDYSYTGYPIPGPITSSSPTATQMAPCISDINAKYTALGGTASVLGASTSAITGYFTSSGAVQCYQMFTTGSIEWSAATGAHEVHGDIGAKWANLGYDMSFLALPTTDETVAANNGRFNEFQNGAIYWHGTLGAFALRPEIYAKYKALGAAGSRLGYPTNDTGVLTYNPGMFNHFQGGSIYFSTATGAHEVHGPIRDKWAASNWENGYYGYPESDTFEGLVRGGAGTHFHGFSGDKRHSIYTSAAGTHSISGRIREKWASLGWERSVLGYPQTDTFDYDSFGDQTFETGYIFFSNATGAHEVHGAIGRRYWETGQPEFSTNHTYLGYPISDEIGGLPACKAYGCGLGAKSVFETGSIYWSPVNGAHDMPRAIEQRLEALGGLTGCMGYPVTNWDASTGVVRFEGGQLTWLNGWGSATGSCSSGGTSNPGGMTPVCGGASQACCSGNVCYGQTDCVSGICRQRASCTSNADCFGLGNCEGGSCVPCGATGQTCCWGGSTTEQSCQSGNQCSGSTCTSCGHLYEVCCTNTNLGGLGGQSCSQGHCNGYSCQP